MRLDSITLRALRSGTKHLDMQIKSASQDIEELNILTSNNNAATRYPMIVARELALFERAGLKINYLDSETSVPYLDLLDSGEADSVMLDASEMLIAASRKQLISVVYETMQSAPDVLSVLADSQISSLEQLRGQTIGLSSDRDRVTAQLVLNAAGVGIDEVKTLVVGDSGPVVAKALEDDVIQAYAGGINDTTVLTAFGITMRDLTPQELKANPANNFVVRSDRLDALRPKLETFFRVWAMATRAAKLDRDGVAQMCRAAVPAEWEDADAGWALMDASIALNYPLTAAFGDLEPEVWRAVQGPYCELGLLDAELDPASFLDNSFIGAANAFTDAEIEVALKSWRAAN